MKRPKLFLTDFDGTLSPIVRDYARARVGKGVVAALRKLQGAGWTVVVLSGRGLSDLRSRIRLRGAIFGGNHGWEWSGRIKCAPGFPSEADTKRVRSVMHRAAVLLREWTASIPDVRVEEKKFFVVVHHAFVSTARKKEYDAVIRRARRDPRLSGCRWRRGIKTWELLGPVRWGKGEATSLLIRLLKPAVVIAVGDDVTDEDMFAAVGRNGVAIRVGKKSASRARYFIRRQEDIIGLIDRLADGSLV